MRIPASKVYRAFPELDKFSDEQCANFVRAADRHRHGRAIRLVLQFLISGVVFAALGGGMVAIANVWRLGSTMNPSGGDPYMVWAGLFMLVAFFGTGFTWLVTKDILLRRSIRKVMDDRGTCPVCRYGLTGLPVTADGRVICPECGHAIAADTSLGEIQPDGSGQVRFIPSADARPVIKPFIGKETKRKIIRWIIWGPVSIIVLLAILAGSYEGFIRWQASQASKGRITAADLERFSAKAQGAQPHDDNAATAFAAAIRFMEAFETELNETKYPNRQMMPWYANFTVIYDPAAYNTFWQSEGPETQKSYAAELLNGWSRAGALDRLLAASKHRAAVRGYTQMPGLPLAWSFYNDQWKTYRVSSAIAAWMAQAEQRGDDATWLMALEVNLALSRVNAMQPTLWEHTQATAMDMLTLDRIHNMIAAKPGGTWAVPALDAWKRQDYTPNPQVAFDGELLLSRDMVCWFFEQPNRTRFGKYSAGPEFSGGGPWLSPPQGRLGTLAENERVVRDAITAQAALAAMDPYLRPPASPWTPSPLFVANAAFPMLVNAVPNADRHRCIRRAIAMLLALERHRVETGRYPESLLILVSAQRIPYLPDPWTGKPFIYRVNPDGLGYILYSTGPDGQDNGGFTPTDASPLSSTPDITPSGSDAILGSVNQPK